MKTIIELMKRIEELPKGYISRKTINGKERLYLQWREGSKVRSRYIKKSEQEEILRLVAERKELQQQLDLLTDANGTNSNHAEGYVKEEVSGYKAVSGISSESFNAIGYLKWCDDCIAEIDDDHNVHFIDPHYNSVVAEYTRGHRVWTRQEFLSFLEERIVSKDRRDIDSILSRLGLVTFDPLKIGLATRAVNARDMLWIADNKDDLFEDAITDVFGSVFLLNVDKAGDSVDTPEGQNIKRYGVLDGCYGIFKRRLSPVITDVESEIAVYELAKRLGIHCCEYQRVDDDTVFSKFEYDFTKEYIVHFRRLIEGERRSEQESGLHWADRSLLHELMSVRPQYLSDYVRMIALDFITRQDDRHLSNIALRISADSENFYPLYDNGRSLFYEDTEETVKRACHDIRTFSTAFGRQGTYFDHISELKKMGIDFSRLMDLDVSNAEIKDILLDAGFSGYRLDGSAEWIRRCMEYILH